MTVYCMGCCSVISPQLWLWLLWLWLLSFIQMTQISRTHVAHEETSVDWDQLRAQHETVVTFGHERWFNGDLTHVNTQQTKFMLYWFNLAFLVVATRAASTGMITPACDRIIQQLKWFCQVNDPRWDQNNERTVQPAGRMRPGMPFQMGRHAN